MVSLRRPSTEAIRDFLASQSNFGFTYTAVGATASQPPAGYTVDRTRVKLGEGEEVFTRAQADLRQWEQFRLGWIEAWSPKTTIQPGDLVAIIARNLGVWWLNACRIVYVIDEDKSIRRYGYASGTLPAHAGEGEERFFVEWNRASGEVWYDILAFSRPQGMLTRIGHPYMRRIQKRFGRESAAAMLRAAGDSGKTPPGTTQSTPGLREPDIGSREAATSRRRFLIWALKVLVAVVVLWLLLAYVILPALWRHYEHHPALEDAPKTTVTAQGIPGDPLNVGLIGTEEEVVEAMIGSGWDAADPVTMKSSLRIASSVLRNRPYADAPVSSLFVFGRRQDLAFEKPVGNSARRRHYIRFWKSAELGRGGVPLWIGAVTFDRSVGLSHRTGQFTHHIGPDIDAERDRLFADLHRGGRLRELFQVTGVGATVLGRNGCGDQYYTDGELTIGVLASHEQKDKQPERLANPVAVQIKEQLWSAIRPLLQSLPGQ
jgi:uncharacterized protein (UPF0548 family)